MNPMLFCISFLLFYAIFKITSSTTTETINRYYNDRKPGSRLKHYNELNPEIHPLPSKWQYKKNDVTTETKQFNNPPSTQLNTNNNNIKTHLNAPMYVPINNDNNPSQIDDMCEYTMGNDIGTDFIILYDNSCNLNTNYCNHLLNGINKIISKILIFNNRIQTMQIKNNGHSEIDISFDNIELQNNPIQYINFITQNAKCTNGGTGTTDIIKGLNDAIHSFNNTNNIRKRKIIIINACMDNRKEKLCNKINKHLNDLNIEIFIINLIHGSQSDNVITQSDANTYLKCILNNEMNQICTNKYNTFGISKYEFDYIIETCLLPQICVINNNMNALDDSIELFYPTPEPTPRPTPSPTLRPTINPTTAFPTNITPNPTKKKKKKRTNKPTPKPTVKPTKKRTNKPTPKPTVKPTKKRMKIPTKKPKHPCPPKNPIANINDRSVCTNKLRHGKQIDFVIFIDNSCGLSKYNCNNVLEGVGKIIYKLLDYPNTRIKTVNFGERRGGFKTLIDFNDQRFQRNAKKYVKYIKQYGKCTNGGNGNTNLYFALRRVLMTMDKTKITKFIIVSACKDTTNKVCKMAKYNIEMYFINLVSVMNDIYNINIFENQQDAYDYVMCLTNKKQKRICVNDNVNLGVVGSEFDQIIQNCLLPNVCMVK